MLREYEKSPLIYEDERIVFAFVFVLLFLGWQFSPIIAFFVKNDAKNEFFTKLSRRFCDSNTITVIKKLDKNA